MTKLQQIVEENNISYYELAKLSKKNPNHYTGVYKKKIRGEKTMTPNEYLSILEFLTNKLGRDITSTDVPFETIYLKVS